MRCVNDRFKQGKNTEVSMLHVVAGTEILFTETVICTTKHSEFCFVRVKTVYCVVLTQSSMYFFLWRKEIKKGRKQMKGNQDDNTKT